MVKRSLAVVLSMLLAAYMVLPVFAAQTGESSGASNSYTYASESIDSQYTYDGELGALYTPAKTTFRVWAPLASSVTLNRYATGSDEEAGAASLGKVTMEKLMNGSSFTGVWTAEVSGDIANTYYTYSVTTPDVKGSGSATHETQDVYSTAVGVNGRRSMVVDLDSTDPAGWENDKHVLPNVITTSYVWEVHVKDFSYNENSGVSDKNRGKFLAFTETGTTLNGEGDIPTCIDYLKQLGVTTVQINPFFDFSSVDETGSDTQFNWGYDPMNYNVPEGSYSSDPYHGEVRINECKQMIQALHSAGLSVVMDVVYNHTASTDSCFGYTMPKYYYRMNADGTYSNGSGCGNETASERAMYRKFMIDSILYWTNEYHVDGFRFDLMALHDTETLNMVRDALDKVDERITMWGEGWTGGGSTYPDKTCTGKAFQASYLWDHGDLNYRIGFFNDGIRNAMKGDTGSVYSKGWLQGNVEGTITNICDGMQAKKEYSIGSPAQAVTYDACHDNTTLWDQLCSSQGLEKYYHDRHDKLVAQNKLAGAMLMMSQGVTFILAGEEMGRSKGGNENSYNAPPDVNMIDWSLAATNSDIVSYYRGLRDIRDHFWILNDNIRGDGGYYFLNADTTIACTITNSISGQWRQVLFLANCADYPVTYQVPSGSEQYWAVIADENEAGTTKLRDVTDGKFTIAADSVVIAVDATSYNSVKIDDPTCKVHVNYIDETTGQTFAKRTFTGKLGEEYYAYAPARYGNEFILDSFDGEPRGTFTASDVTVNANYAYVRAGSVTVNYCRTGTTEQISSPDVYYSMIGDTITLGDTPSFVGYKCDETQLPDKTVKIVPGNTDVNFYYTPTSSSVTLHFKHSGGQSWDPILWLWGSKNGSDTGNYCTNKTWPGDTLYDADGDGWFDKTFAINGDDCYNFLISNSSGEQTVDYRGLTQNELWIMIDDSRVWNYTDNLTIYTEDPQKNSDAPIAVRYGAIGYSRELTPAVLYDITCPANVTARVNNNAVAKTIAGAAVELTLGGSSTGFKGFTVNDGAVAVKTKSATSCEFTMPEGSVTVKAEFEELEKYTVDMTSLESEAIPEELGQAIRKLPCYDSATESFDLNGDGTPDLRIESGASLTLVRLSGADKLVAEYTFDLSGAGYSDKYETITFKLNDNIVTVSFDSNGGFGTMENEVIPAGEYTIPACTFKPAAGYIFDAWLLGTARVKPGDVRSITEDTTLTVLWEKLQYVEEKPASCEEDGCIAYYKDTSGRLYADGSGTPLPDINNDGLFDINDTIVKATGHKYGAPTWEWNGFDSAAAAFVCENDASHTVTLDAEISVSQAPDGTVYIASVMLDGKDYTDVKQDITGGSDTETDTQSDTESDTPTDTESDTETDTQSDTESDTESGTDSSGETASDTETDSGTESDNSSDTTDTESDTDSSGGESSDTDSDDSDTDSDEFDLAMVGDVDGDNSVTSSDALLLLRASIGLASLDDVLLPIADVTGDGTADSSDALEILRYSAMISENVKIGTLVKIPKR